MQRKQFKPVMHWQSKRKLELVHSDVCGPLELQVESIGGSRYFVTIIDDYSKCVSVHTKQKCLRNSSILRQW